MDDPQESLRTLIPLHEAYLVEAQRLQRAYASQIHILIGFEAEFIRPEYYPLVKALAEPAIIDYFIGSVHHVHSIPIDYNKAFFADAIAAAGGSEEQLYSDYYDLQHEMLAALKPRVVGHFDLIRLMSDEPDRDVRKHWKGVWAKIMRNLELAAKQGAWLECNTAALRKGLAEPYPGRQIAEEWLKLGGKFTMSDDSHGIGQVATNYARGLAYLESLGVNELWTLERKPHPGVKDGLRAMLVDKAVTVAEIRERFPITTNGDASK